MPKYNLTNEQLDELKEAYCELICDSMDWKSMEQFVHQTLMQDYEKYNQHEIFEEIECTMCDVVLQELIDNLDATPVDDNNSTHTYSLNVDESITFPVHKEQSIFVLFGSAEFFLASPDSTDIIMTAAAIE